MQYEIKNIWTMKTQFACELGDEFEHQGERERLGAAVLMAVKEKANLRDANLRGADLSGADLRGADLSGSYLSGADLSGSYLRGADLRDANLRGADLSGADLSGAYLRGAKLSGANLRGAYLSGADLRGKKLIGDRPIFQVGPIGSESRCFFAFLTDAGLMLQVGCFFGTRDEFLAKLEAKHGDNEHAEEYLAALLMIDAHARIWTPKEIKE